MKQQTVLDKIRDIILPYMDEPCDIKMETHVLQDLMINSFDYTNIITNIEEALKINIDNLSMYHVKDLVQFILKYDKKDDSE